MTDPMTTKVFVWIRDGNHIDHWFSAQGLVNIEDNEVAVLINKDYLPELLETGGAYDKKKGEKDLHHEQPKGGKASGDDPDRAQSKKRKKQPNKRMRRSTR